MSKLNPNAGEFVPSFPTTAPVVAPSVTTTVAPALSSFSTGSNRSLSQLAMETQDATQVETAPAMKQHVYPLEYLLQFQTLCDRVPGPLPAGVQSVPQVQRIGSVVKGRIVYTVEELMRFQYVYHQVPEGIMYPDVLLTSNAGMSDKKGKGKAGKNKDKNRTRQGGSAASMAYDPSVVCYFNPTEYSAALYAAAASNTEDHSALEGDQSLKESVEGSGNVVDPKEELEKAISKIKVLLDSFTSKDQVDTFASQFEVIAITHTSTLQRVIGMIFDRAIASPKLCEAFAQLCVVLSEKTPEFKEGARTMNFRRILLTQCYEALVEEPHPSVNEDQVIQSSNDELNPSKSTEMPQQPWRRQCMLQNVCFVGELFRRQLLTENIMHVCVAMMLEDEAHPHVQVLEAACRLLQLVGDLLDGSSPASRRTMDEYFHVLHVLRDRPTIPSSVKEMIAELTSARAGGWIKRRTESSGCKSPISDRVTPKSRRKEHQEHRAST